MLIGGETGESAFRRWLSCLVNGVAGMDCAATDKSELDPAQPGSGKRVLSFFTGAGGLDLGFEQAGFETVYATDHDRDSCATLRLNVGAHFNARLRVECADILAIDPATLPTDVDLVIGGPPCQSFSASGRRAGGAAGRLDDRGNLFQAYARIIAHVAPTAFVFENVRGILATNKGEDWKEIVSTFAALGYTLSYRLLDALDYGAPQQRERMFLVGHRMDTEFLFPEPTHGPDSPFGIGHVTAGEALADVVQDEDTQELVVKGGKYSHLLPLVPPGQNYLYFTAKRGYPQPIFAYRSRFSDFLYKADPNSPIKTLIASPGKYTGPLHWENRYFSTAEYKRLQGFPDNYRISGSRADVIRQIGNSVSPKIAYRLALAIAQQIWGSAGSVRLLESGRTLSFDRRKGAKARATRLMHEGVVASPAASAMHFQPVEFRGPLPLQRGFERPVSVVYGGTAQHMTIHVAVNASKVRFARMTMRLGARLHGSGEDERATLTVSVAGNGPEAIRAMWDAVDDWVRRASGFHSLFELYGHFTEPHPVFSIATFEVYSKLPIAKFAKHAANFGNCSIYLPKSHLIDMFEKDLETDDFATIAIYLRAHRFDIRSKETNVAIAADKYMIAYPFTLPARRQMNFSVKAARYEEAAE